MGKNNVDKWSVFHGLGTFLLTYVFSLVMDSKTDAIVSTMVSMVLWELIDEFAHLYPKSFLVKFFDARGASIMDYTIGYIGIGIYILIINHPEYSISLDWNYIIVIFFACTVVMIFINSISYQMTKSDIRKRHGNE